MEDGTSRVLPDTLIEKEAQFIISFLYHFCTIVTPQSVCQHHGPEFNLNFAGTKVLVFFQVCTIRTNYSLILEQAIDVYTYSCLPVPPACPKYHLGQQAVGEAVRYTSLWNRPGTTQLSSVCFHEMHSK